MGCPLAEAPPLLLLPPEEGGVVQAVHPRPVHLLAHRRPAPLLAPEGLALEVPSVRGR